MKEIERLQKDDNFSHNYTLGMSHLQKSGVFEVLRKLGQVRSWNNGTSVEHVALNGAWSNGFQECLDTLFNFLELYIQPQITPSQFRMDFGGLNRAVENEIITEEEADGIRRGNYINIGPKPPTLGSSAK